MDAIAAANARLAQAGDVPAILGAACDAFETMLPLIEKQQEPTSGAFTAFVMAAAIAANGRDAVLRAPSVPFGAYRLPAAETAGHSMALEAAIDLAGLSCALYARLTLAASLARCPGDREACAEGARQAMRLMTLLVRTARP